MPGRTHSPDFKLDIVRQVEAGGKSKAQLCREHDLSPPLIHRWQQQYEQHGEAAFDKNKPVSETESLERRLGQNGRRLGQNGTFRACPHEPPGRGWPNSNGCSANPRRRMRS